MGRRRQVDLSIEVVPIGTLEERERAVQQAARYILECFIRSHGGGLQKPPNSQSAPLNKHQVENDNNP